MTIGQRVMEALERRRAEREANERAFYDQWSNPSDLGNGMVSEEISERPAEAHETPSPSFADITVEQFYELHQVDGRAVLAWTHYRNDREPLLWICCIRNKFCAVSYWVCHHSKTEIRQVKPEQDVLQLGAIVTEIRRAD